MPKRYHLILDEVEVTPGGVKKTNVIDMEDYGYFVANALKALHKKVREPAPIIPVVGQTEMELR